MNQTAPNGQLVLADASDPDHAEVGAIVREYQAKNQRMVLQKDRKSRHCRQYQRRSALAEGITWALADHKQTWPPCLYTMGKAILAAPAGLADDFLYSDEALF